MKKNKWIPVLFALAAAGIYHAAKGRGAFNPIRFSAQHNAVSRYVETHYPGASYSEITALPDGWSCVVHAPGKEVLLFLTKSENGVYIFHEKPM